MNKNKHSLTEKDNTNLSLNYINLQQYHYLYLKELRLFNHKKKIKTMFTIIIIKQTKTN